MNSFITGSRAYGKPRDDSDIDLVVCVSSKDLKKLWALALNDPSNEEKQLRFGKINLVAFNLDCPEERGRYVRWSATNQSLIARKPVSKEEAIEAFRASDAEKNYTQQEAERE